MDTSNCRCTSRHSTGAVTFPLHDLSNNKHSFRSVESNFVITFILPLWHNIVWPSFNKTSLSIT